MLFDQLQPSLRGNTASAMAVATLRGAELVTNGTFTSGLTGWTASGAGAALTNPAGAMQITNGGAAEANAVLDGVTATAGVTYEVVCEVTARTGGASGFVVVGAQNLPLSGGLGVRRGLVSVITGGPIRIATGTPTTNDSITVDNVSIRAVPAFLLLL